MLVVLANNLTPSFRDHFNALAKAPGSGIEIIPASINVFNSARPQATRERFAELFFDAAPGDYAANLARLKNQSVTLVQSTSGAAAEHFVELLVAIRSLKRLGAGPVTVVLPYVWGARQDRSFEKDGRMASIAADDVPFLLKTAGADKAILAEMHSKASEDLFVRHFGQGNVTFQASTELFAQDLSSHKEIDPGHVVVCAPDGWDKQGDAGQKRARDFLMSFRQVSSLTAQQEKEWLAGLVKKRVMLKPGVTRTEVQFAAGEVAGKTCVMVDDMGDSCGTIIDSGSALIKEGAAGLQVYLTHWVGDAASLEKLLRARKNEQGDFLVDRLAVTDTAPGIEDDIRALENKYPEIRDRVSVLPTAPLFAKQILSL